MKQQMAQAAAGLVWLGALLAPAFAAGPQGSTTVYRCPGNPVLYTDQLTPAQASEKGCRTIEGAPITIMQSARPRAAASSPATSRPEGRIVPTDQRARDDERRSILETELRREEDRLAELKKEFNNGEPERLGSERNYQKYLDRVAELKAAVARKEADIASLKREIGKLPAQ
jgi:hypothetical protein